MQPSLASPVAPARPFWWQWLTVLSLDAPAVAIGWQWLFGQSTGAKINWHHHVILGSAVWLAYAADRWIEGWLVAPAQIQTQRHAFYQRFRWPVLTVWLTVLVTAVGVAWCWLQPYEFDAGLIVLGPVLLYLLSHQLAHRRHPWRVPKEICVALLFAAGTSCFSLAQPHTDLARLVLPLAFFAALCFTNCALISVWESTVDRAHGQVSLALQHPNRARWLHALPWTLAILCLVAWRSLATLGMTALVASALLLGLIDIFHQRHGRQLSRALVDLALLTPLPLWLLSAWS